MKAAPPRSARAARRSPPRQRGAALLTAMIIVTLVATLASAMVWQQWRAVQVEAAERARVQAAWILAGALDWGRLILAEDARSGRPTALTEPWAVPLAEARLSSFLAADRNNNAADDDGPEAFLSGAISDAQARYNLSNVIDANNKIDPAEFEVLKRLCATIGVSADVATRLAEGMQEALAPSAPSPSAPLLPASVAQLAWFGLDNTALQRLDPYLVLLPRTGAPTSVNINTAPREVLVAAIKALDLSTAEQMLQMRQRAPFKAVADFSAQFPNVAIEGAKLDTKSAYFEIRGRLRLGDRVLEERSLVQRVNANQIRVIDRERIASRDQPGS